MNANVSKALKYRLFIKVILSFLKRERERFPLFVPRRYCVERS